MVITLNNDEWERILLNQEGGAVVDRLRAEGRTNRGAMAILLPDYLRVILRVARIETFPQQLVGL